MYRLELDEKEINGILTVLAEQPYKLAFQLINKIQLQCQNQAEKEEKKIDTKDKSEKQKKETAILRNSG